MKRKYLVGDKKVDITINELSDSSVEFVLDGKTYVVQKHGSDYMMEHFLYTAHSSATEAIVNGKTVKLKVDRLTRAGLGESVGGDMKSPMPGKILKLCVAEGAEVKIGESLVIMEAMKMEHTIKATKQGKLVKMLVCEGQLVQGGKDLFEFVESE